jgi:glutamate dehydrogenase (NAD(P)+)
MPPDERQSDANDLAVEQFDLAAGKLDLDPNVAVRLRRPDRAMIVSVPTRMDDGRVHVLRVIGYSTTTCWGRSKAEFATIPR